MSHSRILVLVNNYYKVDCEDILETMQSYGNGADSVIESDSSYEADLDWFKNWAKDYGIEVKGKNLIIKDKSIFYDKMKEAVFEGLEDISGRGRWKATEALRMVHGFWIYSDNILCTLPYFLEDVKEGDTFKVRCFLDYHY